MSGLWALAFGFPQILYASLTGLSTGLSAERACGIVLLILLTLYLIVENQLKQLRKEIKTKEDETAHELTVLPPDLRALPMNGRDVSLEYCERAAKRLKHQLGGYFGKPKSRDRRSLEC